MESSFRFKNYYLKEINWEEAALINFESPCEHLIIPSVAIHKKTKKIFTISKISLLNCACYLRNKFDYISFSDSSPIEVIPVSFIMLSKSKFVLPPKIKRIYVNKGFDLKTNITILVNDSNKFISISKNNNNIIHHYPLEITKCKFLRNHLIIRNMTSIIGPEVFKYNLKIKVVEIPESVSKIGKNSFCYCKNLRSVKFHPKSCLKIIGDSSFFETSIHSIDIPSSVEEIGMGAFGCNLYLTTIIFHHDSKLRIIDDNAFHSTGIKLIEIPRLVEKIGKNSFSLCQKLEVIKFDPNSRLKFIDNEAFRYSTIKSIEIPKLVKKIGVSAFSRCKMLKEVKFHADSGLEIFDEEAFSHTSLSIVEIPSSVVEIRKFAFSKCQIEILIFKANSQLKNIGNSAFSFNEIKTIYFPKTIEIIGNGSFFGCKSLESITFHSDTSIKAICDFAFDDTSVDMESIYFLKSNANNEPNKEEFILSQIFRCKYFLIKLENLM